MTIQNYDRTFLEGLVDKYYESIVSHDTSILPLSENVKFTENTVQLEAGDGLWATASHEPTYKNVFTDTNAGQAGAFAVMKENDMTILMSARLKAEKNLVTEIETVVVRAQGGRPANEFPLLKSVNPIFYETLGPSERLSREEMIKIADLYFDGIEQDTGEFVPFDDNCYRVENGRITANNPNPPTGPDVDPILRLSALNCKEQFDMKTLYFINSIQPRRHPLVDEERGLVLSYAMFVHKGNVLSAEIEGLGHVETPPFARRPSSVFVSELFKIKNGKLIGIEVVGTMFPYGIKSGWDN